MSTANLRWFTGIAAAVGLLGLSAFGASAASAQPAPPTLSGEELSAPNTLGGEVNCDTSGPFSFTVSGTATGPYPGTFSETISGDALYPEEAIAGDYTASFTITSPTGDVTGTETNDGDGVACYQNPTDFSINGSSDYQATIQNSGGTYTDQGQTGFEWNEDASIGQAPNGSDDFFSSQTQTTPVALQTITTVTSSANGSSILGQPVTFTATVSPSDGGGSVAFSADGSVIPGCGSLPPMLVGGNGEATCTTSALPAGMHAISAAYSGDGSYLASTGTLPGGQPVSAAPLSLTVTGSRTYGEPATQAFTLTGSTGFMPGDSLADLTGTLGCTSTVPATAPAGSYTGTIGCSGLSDPDYAISYTDGGFTVAQAGTSLGYTGTTGLATPASLVPAASLSSGAAVCQAGQPVTFTLNANPVTGAAGTYNLETASTGPAGTATGAAIPTSGWQAGSYTITAAFTGTASCGASQATGELAVAAAGTAAAGAGTYTVPGAGIVEMGFAVGKLPHSSQYAGRLSIADGKDWLFAASVTSYTSPSATSGVLSGTGTLWWNPALNRGRGGWQQAATGVAYTATFTATTAVAKASFGITIDHTPAAGQPSALPNSGPVMLTQGGVWVAPLGAKTFF